MEEVIKRVTERDTELPNEVTLHYFIYCLNLKSGKVEWKREFYTGHPPGGRHRKNSFVSESPVTDGRHVYLIERRPPGEYTMKGTLTRAPVQ